jgi:uncharacterized tellurite resistance protein B-like protein
MPANQAISKNMFDTLHRLLTGLDHPRQAAEQNDSAFALAVLLIEVARSSDNRLADREEGVIERALARRFSLEREQVIRLVKAGEEGAIQATDLFHFTQVVVNNFSNEDRIGVIEMLWEVAYADGVLTGDEDTLIRRVAGLIDVSDRDRGDAKLRVRERVEANPAR